MLRWRLWSYRFLSLMLSALHTASFIAGSWLCLIPSFTPTHTPTHTHTLHYRRRPLMWREWRRVMVEMPFHFQAWFSNNGAKLQSFQLLLLLHVTTSFCRCKAFCCWKEKQKQRFVQLSIKTGHAIWYTVCTSSVLFNAANNIRRSLTSNDGDGNSRSEFDDGISFCKSWLFVAK